MTSKLRRSCCATQGLASAANKSGRIAAEGRVALIVGADAAVIIEVNCETDFVAKDDNFKNFVSRAAEIGLAQKPADLEKLMALEVSDSVTLEDARRDLVAKIWRKYYRASIRAHAAARAGRKLYSRGKNWRPGRCRGWR